MNNNETIEYAVTWAITTARDSSHGYDQAYRWGPNYDCSSFVITAWQNAGVPVKTNGASYTGNMKPVFIKCGFHDVTSQVNLATGYGLQRGDVLLNTRNHVEMYIGGGQNVKASINERGGITGGQTGDQSGREICIGGYYNYPWDHVLRYMGGESDFEQPIVTVPEQPVSTPNKYNLQKGDINSYVKELQEKLIELGYSLPRYGADGDFGDETLEAVNKFQDENGLVVDGIVGHATWAKIEELLNKKVQQDTKTPTVSSPEKPILRFGSKGPSVKELQEKLIALGYSCGSYGADGKFGWNTYKAVLRFQREHGLEIDGVVGPKTWAELLK